MPAPDLAGTQAERLAAQFYAWERRGRGWSVWPFPVDIEPPFRPFLFHALPAPPIYDDGKVPTLGSKLIGRLRGQSNRTEVLPASPPTWELPEPTVEPAEEEPDVVPFSIGLPADLRTGKDVAEQFLTSLTHARHRVGLEIVGVKNAIRLQLVCREADSRQVSAAVRARFPDAIVSRERDELVPLYEAGLVNPSVVIDFGLSEEFMLPLRTMKSFDPDPLITAVAAMDDLEEDEAGVLQILFRPVRNPWAESVLRAVSDWDGGAFFADAPQMVAGAKQKAARPLFAVSLRVAATSADYDRTMEIARRIAATFAECKEPLSNEFIPLTNDDYPDDAHWSDLLARSGRRAGMLLNLDELVSLAHLPSASVRSSKLVRDTKKTKAAPDSTTRAGIMLGENLHQGVRRDVRIGPAERMRHTYLIGASGTGKSNLLLNMMVQDIEGGEGMGLLDPHGDLADEVLARIPESRLKDVILFDPSDEELPVAWNILQAHTPLEKTLLSSDITATFKRLSTSWGDQMTSVLGNAVLAILESDRGGSIGDLRRFLVDADWREGFLSSVTDPEIVFYWQKEFPLLAGRPQASILTRLDTFLRPRPVRAMVTARKDRLDFRAVLDERKIFIAKLAQGAIGEENSSLLGSLLVSKFHQVALSRQDTDLARRAYFYLYVDEFHHFITPTLASLLSGARKYRLGLTLAHQDLRQLVSRDAEVAAAAIANPCTRICFRVGEADARMLKESFSNFDGKDLQNLGVGEAIMRVERSDWDFNLKTFLVPAVDAETARRRREEALRLSRAAYGREREAEVQPVAAPAPAPASAPSNLPVREARTVKKLTSIEKIESPPLPVTDNAPLPGRGGRQHTYLQALIKKIAESKGYKVTVEQPVLGGAGRVDVSLDGNGRKIACEISVHSTPTYEVGNVRKCLAAGYDEVALISSETKTLRRLRQALEEALDTAEQTKVAFLSPEDFVAYLETFEMQAAAREDTVRGYKVKVAFSPVAEGDKKARRQAVSAIIANAMKRLKRPAK